MMIVKEITRKIILSSSFTKRRKEKKNTGKTPLEFNTSNKKNFRNKTSQYNAEIKTKVKYIFRLDLPTCDTNLVSIFA